MQMQAMLIGALFSAGQAILVRLLSKAAIKVLFVNTVDLIVKSTSTVHDDKIWEQLAPILSDFDKEPEK
jgi:hypothetical protein